MQEAVPGSAEDSVKQQLDPGDLAGALQTNQQQRQQNGSLLSTINSMPDSNKDGWAIDEVAGMLGKFLNTRR